MQVNRSLNNTIRFYNKNPEVMAEYHKKLIT